MSKAFANGTITDWIGSQCTLQAYHIRNLHPIFGILNSLACLVHLHLGPCIEVCIGCLSTVFKSLLEGLLCQGFTSDVHDQRQGYDIVEYMRIEFFL